MVISCAKCSKSFLLPDDKIKPAGTRVRCKQCGHEFVVMPPAAAPPPQGFGDDGWKGHEAPASPPPHGEPVLVPEPDPLAGTPASGLQRSEPRASRAGDVASSYEITFQGLDSGTSEAPLSTRSRDDEWKNDGAPASPMEEPPPTGGMSDADLVSALQSDPLTAVPEEAPPSGGDVSIDFGILDEVPEPPPPVAPSGGASPGDFEEPPPPQGSAGGAPGSFEMDGLSLAEPEASAPGQDAASFQLDNLSLEEPPPEEHAPSMMAEPMPGGGGGAQSVSAGADPLAGLDLDFTLDEKAMGGAPPEPLHTPAPPMAAPEPSIFEPTSMESPPPPATPRTGEVPREGRSPERPPTAVTQESLKAEFESLGRDSLIKGNLDEIQAPESPPSPGFGGDDWKGHKAAASSAFQAPPPPKEPEAVRAAPIPPTTMAAKAAARAAEKEKKVAHVRRLELRSPAWMTVPLWAILAACFGAVVWWFSPGPTGGAATASTPGGAPSMIASWIGLRPLTEDVSPSIRRVRGRSYQNAYGEKFYIVTGVAPKVWAETQSLRATFLDAQGWKMGQETAFWVKEIPPREFALLGLRELRQALTNLAVGFSESGADVSFVLVYPTPLKTPDHYLLEWSDANVAAPSAALRGR